MAKEVKSTQSIPERSLFSKDNYVLMIAGIVIILIGFVLMMGGASTSPDSFNVNDVYSPRRITWAPLFILIGLAVEVYAIMKKPKQQQ
ncbi:Protein of unknown function (DUF3098) [Chitinophaga skermanii]|uniref:DUF3098 family protein n=1 Tax=Chitinophaga skermanii TaxID=331697 RepID=A0A327QIU4_9BACT|nr:DUF3098 domain-containing protein [Chitinophaga skermanii]RAJ04181.1 Protein of unknown function (DUF3098) [Chitinophaga skermanii]